MSTSKYFNKKENKSVQNVESKIWNYNQFNDPNIPDIVELKDVEQAYGDNVIIKDLNFLAEKKS